MDPNRLPLWHRRNLDHSPAPGQHDGDEIERKEESGIDLEDQEHFLPQPAVQDVLKSPKVGKAGSTAAGA